MIETLDDLLRQQPVGLLFVALGVGFFEVLRREGAKYFLMAMSWPPRASCSPPGSRA
jgi:hypothetical protein